MMLLLTAFVLMVSANLTHHLGLSQAIAEVASKVLSCGQCLTFWTVLAGMVYIRCEIVTAVFFAITMAYISNWFALLLLYLQRLFYQLYGKENIKKEN